MAKPSPANLRAFVRRHTRLDDVAGLPGVRLHQGDDVMAICRLTGMELGLADPAIPYWAFAWAGGLAIARYLVDNPGEVTGRRVLDIASGSGLCAIVAMRLGAESAHAADLDPFSEAAVPVNAAANGVHVTFNRGDLLTADPPECDVILAGDVCYEPLMAEQMIAWLGLAAARGIRVLIGDPGRKYLPSDLRRLATYRVRTSLELESAEIVEAGVYTLSL